MKIFTIGRYPENNLVLSNPMISGKHAEITVDDNNVITFIDHSSNGSYVNGQFINRAEKVVTSYDIIKFPDGTVFDWSLIFNSSTATPVAPEAPVNIPVSYPEVPAAAPARHVDVDFSKTFSEAFSNGFRHTFRVLAVFLLWLITIWIPYLNVGTTIALALLPSKMACDDSFSPFYIFDSEYRKCMGLYLLTSGFMFSGIMAASVFMLFPGFVLAFSWMLSLYFMFEKKKNPIDALVASNNATYGSKWTIFFIYVLLWLIFAAVGGLLAGLFVLVGMNSDGGFGAIGIIGGIITLLASFCGSSISLSATASIWRQLRDNA